jgi:hypothetical protein
MEFIGCEREAGYLNILIDLVDLWIFPDMADQGHFVDASFHDLIIRVKNMNHQPLMTTMHYYHTYWMDFIYVHALDTAPSHHHGWDQ